MIIRLPKFTFTDDSNELVTVLEPMHPLGDLYDVTADGTILFVEFEQGRSELWLGDFLPE